jgi:hypothetical protein
MGMLEVKSVLNLLGPLSALRTQQIMVELANRLEHPRPPLAWH